MADRGTDMKLGGQGQVDTLKKIRCGYGKEIANVLFLDWVLGSRPPKGLFDTVHFFVADCGTNMKFSYHWQIDMLKNIGCGSEL